VHTQPTDLPGMTQGSAYPQGTTCFGNNEVYRSTHAHGFRVHHWNSPEIAGALAALLPDPDACFAAGDVCKHGTRSHAGKVTLAGKAYFLKRYNDRGSWYRFRHLFKHSRAIHAWQISCDFHTAQVPVPRPLICLEERRSFLLRRSYILMELVEGAITLRDLWPSLAMTDKVGLVAECAEIIGRMHKSGRVHGDLKWSNLLVQGHPGSLRLTLVDLDSCARLDWRRRNGIGKDIGVFLDWLDRCEADGTVRQRFLSLWKQWAR